MEVIAHSPNSVLSAHPSLVREVGDQGVVLQPELPQRGQDVANAVIDPADLRRRVGEQTGLLLRARVKRTPSEASRSRCGVRMSGLP
jgi:hypothetical protein